METEGCWLNDNFLISGKLQHLGSNISATRLFLNKVRPSVVLTLLTIETRYKPIRA